MVSFSRAAAQRVAAPPAGLPGCAGLRPLWCDLAAVLGSSCTSQDAAALVRAELVQQPHFCQGPALVLVSSVP